MTDRLGTGALARTGNEAPHYYDNLVVPGNCSALTFFGRSGCTHVPSSGLK
jgi:hypothetical protein